MTHIGNISTTVKTADMASLLHARGGNEHAYAARNGGNGHRRRLRHQIHHGRRRAAQKADTACMLVEDGMSVAEAIERCETSPAYFYAMKTLRESDPALHHRVLEGDEPVLASAKRVKNAAIAIAAYWRSSAFERGLFRRFTTAPRDVVSMLLNLTPDQLVAVSNALGLDWVWDKMIEAAMAAAPAAQKTVVAEPVITDVA